MNKALTLIAEHVAEIDQEVKQMEATIIVNRNEANRLASPHLQAVQQAEARLKELLERRAKYQAALEEKSEQPTNG